MAVTSTELRQNFPEFADTTRYPEVMVVFWLGYADKLLYDTRRWEDMRDYGIQLVAAHQITIAARNRAAAAAGGGAGSPGGTAGAVSSKSVGGVSVSYDTGSTVLADGGYWNMTSYGVMFWQLVQIVGTGGFQLV